MAGPVRLLALALLLPDIALAQTQQYLPEPTIAAAQARSAQQCASVGCDGVNTKYWWATVALQDGTAALRIEEAGTFAASTLRSTPRGSMPVGLTPAEQAALVPYATECNAKLLAWCIAETAFVARFAPAQVTALDAAAAPCGTDWAAIKAKPVTDLQVAGQPLASACAAQGLQYDWRTILAPMPVEVVPP